jgi:hypothetical protein
MNDRDSQSVPDLEEEVVSLDAPLTSQAIRRLVEEIRTEELDVSRTYNRTYNRHNR